MKRLLTLIDNSVQVKDIQDKDVICHVKNSATLAGPLFTAHASQVHIDLPTLTEVDKEVNFPPAYVICQLNSVL
jgi:hypothetical protein